MLLYTITQAAAKLLDCGDEEVFEIYVLYASPLFREKILGAKRFTALENVIALRTYSKKAAMHKEHRPQALLHRRSPKASLRLRVIMYKTKHLQIKLAK